jgi:hypothetical protein
VADDPREAVLEHLARKPRPGPLPQPAGQPWPRTPAEVPPADRPRPVAFFRAGGIGADPASVVFLKERGTSNRRLYAVNFDDHQGQPWHWLVAAEQDEHTGSWTARRVAGGGGSWGQHDPWHASEPRLNFCGAWGGEGLIKTGFHGGGEVHRAGADVARVRLTFANGVALEDDAEADLSLCLTDQRVEMPVTIEFFDSAGNLLARQVHGQAHKEMRDRALRRRGLDADRNEPTDPS